MRVTCIQLEIKDQTKSASVASALECLGKAPESDLLVLPELWPSGYFSFGRYKEESEALNGPTVEAIREKALEIGTYVLMGSLVERDGGDLFNTSILLSPRGEIVGTYRKIHLFGYQSQEQKLLKPGKTIGIVELPWGTAGITTCYDLRFPELFRLMMERGAVFFLVPSAWPYARLEAWSLFNQVRALENLSYLISCNCSGYSRGQKFAGHSMIVDPLGRIVAEGGENGEFVSAEIEPEVVVSVRNEFSALKDRVFRFVEPVVGEGK